MPGLQKLLDDLVNEFPTIVRMENARDSKVWEDKLVKTLCYASSMLAANGVGKIKL